MHPLREVTLGQLLDEVVEKFPNNPALVYTDRDFRLTWKELNDSVDELAKGLMAMGIEKGEKIAVWATNVPHWILLMFATARIGAIFLTVNTAYKRDELEYLLKQSDTENLFIIDGFRDSDYIQIVYDLIPELKTQPRDFFASKDFPYLKRVFFLGQEKHRGMYSIPEIIAMSAMTTQKAYDDRKASVDSHDVVNMQYTSGTTGFPKGVMLTHYNLGNNGYWIGEYQRFTDKDKICLPVPMFHCFGCSLGIMASLNHGCAMVLLEQYNPVDVMTAIEVEKCTAVYGVPTMFIAIMEHPLFSKFDFSSLRTGIMAGSLCPITTMEAVIQKMNMKEVTIVFGLTETSPGMTQTHWSDENLIKRTTTVGKPLPYVEVTIKDPETGEVLPPGVHGEICCRGYNVMKGYYKMPEATAKTIDADNWAHSGDIGVFDEDGYLMVTGRLKDMIIRGGENIYPREIEEFLYKMEGISDVQVVGVASQKYGEQVGAFVILKQGFEYKPEDIQDFCRGRISRFKVPKYIAIVDSFPLTTSGKIQKYKLRELAKELWPDA